MYITLGEPPRPTHLDMGGWFAALFCLTSFALHNLSRVFSFPLKHDIVNVIIHF